jgi:hypothetical protein
METERYTLGMPFYDFFSGLKKSKKTREKIINIFMNSDFDAIFWEFPLIKGNDDTEFVFIKTDPKLFGHANPKIYSNYFINENENSAVIFKNISGDTLLISPTPSNGKNDEYSSHIMNFMKRSNNIMQKHNLLKMIGTIMTKNIKEGKTIYMSTHGLGVPWVHIRISRIPKYYQYKKYVEN